MLLHILKNGLNSGILKNYEFWPFHMEIFGFEVNHEYIIQYVEAVEHNSWTFEGHFDTFSEFQTVLGIL